VYGILFAGWSSNVRLKWILFGLYLKGNAMIKKNEHWKPQRELAFYFQLIECYVRSIKLILFSFFSYWKKGALVYKILPIVVLK
jgi:hypothetical protein